MGRHGFFLGSFMRNFSTVTVGKQVHRGTRRTGLERLAEARMRETLRRTTPSEPWVEVQFIDVLETDERGRRVCAPGV